MQYAQFQHLRVSRFILGSNPFSGFSHQSPQLDQEMRLYFSIERIKATLRQAENLGINTLVARADAHVARMLLEYWDEGGDMQWIAQTCPEYGSPVNSVHRAHAAGSKACYIHGGVMDYLYAQNQLDEIQPALDLIRKQGMLAGVAAHSARVIEWAEQHLNLDFYMCCYYNPDRRDERAHHLPGAPETYLEQDRQAMTSLIQTLSRPVIHYKILAAGRNEPRAAFAFAASKMRVDDAVCVGIYPKDRPEMLLENVQLLDECLKKQGTLSFAGD